MESPNQCTWSYVTGTYVLFTVLAKELVNLGKSTLQFRFVLVGRGSQQVVVQVDQFAHFAESFRHGVHLTDVI
jgi:hypothetical protein